MAFDNNILRPTDWLDFIGPRDGRTTGLQGAHLYSEAEWAPNKRFNFLRRLGFDPNETSNGSLNPETQRGGFVLGTAVHSGRQVNAFDELQFDTNDLDSPRFLNTIRRELERFESLC